MDFRKKLISPKTFFRPWLILAVLVLIFFMPMFWQTRLLTGRGNDLSEEFLPLFAYFQQSFWHFHQLPYWQNQVLSGSPLLGDPQNPWIYPPYWLALLMPLDIFAVLLFYLQFYLSALATYFLLRDFKIGQRAALLGSIVYAFSPKFTAHLEAGHLGMIAAFSLAPLLFLAAKKMIQDRTLVWSILLGLAAGWMFLTYFTVFYYAAIIIGVFFCFKIVKLLVKHKKSGSEVGRLVKKVLVGIIVAVGVSSAQILAGLEFFSLTNRQNLTFFDIAQPLWSWKKIFSSIFLPFFFGYNQLQTEELLFPGFFALVLGLLGFFRLTKRWKLVTIVVTFFVVAITINTKTPLFSLFYHYFPGMRYLRITSRIWYVMIFLLTILTAIFVDHLEKTGRKKIVVVILAFTCLELFAFGYTRLQKTTATSVIPKLLLTYFRHDEYYRIYCTTGCLPLGLDAPQNKGNVAGYNPVHLTIYDKFLARAASYHFSGFAPILPPYQVYADKPQPSANLLGQVGTRYVISKYPLSDPGFVKEFEIDGYLVYRNGLERPRLYWTDGNGQTIRIPATFKPNVIRANTDNLSKGELVVNEVFSPAWKARSANGVLLPVYVKDGIIVGVAMPPTKTDSVTITYEPFGSPYSLVLTWLTYLFVSLYFLRKVRTS